MKNKSITQSSLNADINTLAGSELNTHTQTGYYSVNLCHDDVKKIGLPIETCDKEHYVRGSLFVCEKGTQGTLQTDRAIGQTLILIPCNATNPKIYNRCYNYTSAMPQWSQWTELIDENVFKKSIIEFKDLLPISIEWKASCSIDTFVNVGTYDITGQRTNAADGLPIANAASGHNINARLVVLDSSIPGSGKENDKCITQVLTISNSVGGDGNIYMRTGCAADTARLIAGNGWGAWGKLQQNIEVGQTTSLNEYINNGIYSGVYIVGTTHFETFVMAVINNYAIAGATSKVRSISQFKYALNTDGTFSYKTRTGQGNTGISWGEWVDLGAATTSDIQDNSITAQKLSADVRERVENTLRPLYIAAGAEYDNSSGLYKYNGENNITEEKMLEKYVDATKNIFSVPISSRLFLWGKYCSNVNTGLISKSNSTYNGYLATISDKYTYTIDGMPIECFVYKEQSVQCYSDLPSEETHIGSARFNNGQIVPLSGTRYAVITVGNLSLLPESISLSVKEFDNIKENTGDIFIQNSIITAGKVGGTNNLFSTSLLQLGDTIEFEVTSDSISGYLILNNRGVQLGGTYLPNRIYKTTIDKGVFLENMAFGFYVTASQAFADGEIKCKLRICRKDDRFSLQKRIMNIDDSINILKSATHWDKYELFSLGDSLSSGGVWQSKVAELTGCTFDQSKNVKAGAMLSVGGTTSSGTTFDNVLWRAKNLIDQEYITDDGENAIVILENVNDGYKEFDDSVKSVIPTTPIEGYNDSDFSSSFLESIKDKAQLNAVLRLNTVVAGMNLRIDNLPIKAGNITLRVGWSGPGLSNYNVFVEPQATDEETLAHVLDKILEYAYTGITDVLGEDGGSVDFSTGDAKYMPTVEFTDTDNTGMTVTITENPNAKGSVARYFIGENISEWTDTTKWQKGISYSQAWKSTIEMLQRAYPKLHIFVSLFPLHMVTASDYLLPNGAYDTVAYNSVSRMETMRKMQVELTKIAEFYSVPFINVFAECGIGINNMLTYYNASANVHPKKEGYYRFGETVAAQLKRFL